MEKVYSYESALMIGLRAHFSDLNEDRFDHNFACESRMCKCSLEFDSIQLYFLYCHSFQLTGVI